jgi:plasmid stabilization system protein ParE
MTLYWSLRARRELFGILSYIAHDSIDRAIAYSQHIEKKATALKRFPGMGRRIPEFSEEWPHLRELIIDEYRLVYNVSSSKVEIVTIFHGRRRPNDRRF